MKIIRISQEQQDEAIAAHKAATKKEGIEKIAAQQAAAHLAIDWAHLPYAGIANGGAGKIAPNFDLKAASGALLLAIWLVNDEIRGIDPDHLKPGGLRKEQEDLISVLKDARSYSADADDHKLTARIDKIISDMTDPSNFRANQE